MELENVKLTLIDDRYYEGWGYYNNNVFVPHGCGKKYFDEHYAYGNFVDGVLEGPAILSYDYYMYTMHYKNNVGNGWGMYIDRGDLIEFGYYENDQLKRDMTVYVKWYFQLMEKTQRGAYQNMLTMRYYTDNKQVAELLIGYRGGKTNSNTHIPYMGFHFMPDGSVWVGTTETRNLSGFLLHFRSDGFIDVGEFENGNLVDSLPFSFIIDYTFFNVIDKYPSVCLLDFPDNVEIMTNYNYIIDSHETNDDLNDNTTIKQIEELTKLAIQGDIEAQFMLGEHYLDDKNEYKDECKAYEWYLKAANNGHIESMFMVGLAHINGWAKEPSDIDGFKWLSKASDLGHAHSSCWVGHCFLNGIGTEESKAKGVELIKKAAELNNPNGLAYYGSLLMSVKKIDGLDHNYNEGVEYIKKAAILGDLDAQAHLGIIYVTHPKYSTKEGIEWLKKAAEQGNAEAQLALGNQYKMGYGVQQSYFEATKWFWKAAKQDEETAQFNLGTCYFDGHGVRQSYGKALEWFRKANENGKGLWSDIYIGKCYYHLKQYDKALKVLETTTDDWEGESNYYIGLCYYEGKGVDKSFQTAFNYFLKSAEKKNNKAQLQVGIMYKEGIGVIKNEEQAFKWIKLSAEADNSDAQYQLALCYTNGVGTEINLLEAFVWKMKAIENGNILAKEIF